MLVLKLAWLNHHFWGKRSFMPEHNDTPETERDYGDALHAPEWLRIDNLPQARPRYFDGTAASEIAAPIQAKHRIGRVKPQRIDAKSRRNLKRLRDHPHRIAVRGQQINAGA